MGKVILFLRRHDSEDLEHFRKRYLHEHTKRVLTQHEAVRYTANLVEEAPGILTPELFSTPYTGVDAVDELWFETTGYIPELCKSDIHVVEAYRIDERVMQYCPPHWPIGQRSPWFKRISFLRRADGTSLEEFSSYWKEIHGPLALKIHLTVQYIQNLITGSFTDEPPKWDGIVQLDFRSPEDFIKNFFPDPNSRRIMMDDVQKFTGDTDKPRFSLLLSEYIQRYGTSGK